MKSVCEFIYERGKRGTKYLRLRIPSDVRPAYPISNTHVTRSLGTTDLREAKARARMELAKVEADFCRARQRLAQRGLRLSSRRQGEQPLGLGLELSHPGVLPYSPDQGRSAQVVVSDAPVAAPVTVGDAAHEARCELAMSLLRGGHVGQAIDVLQALLSSAPPTPRTLLTTLIPGEPSHHKASSPLPSAPTVPTGCPSWDEVFEKWRDFVPDRPKSTTIAAQTPWRALQRFMDTRVATRPCASPALVLAEDMTAFAQDMRARGLAVDTINERLFKVKAVYKIAVGRHLLAHNPAANTLGFKESSAQRRRKRRLPFEVEDLRHIFGSAIYTEHRRSSGQSGEASFWLPLLLFYTGARPEEVAGLAIRDVVRDDALGLYFNIIDRPSSEDHELFEGIPASHRRTLKNGHSVRRVPVAQELVDLGLLRYIEWLQSQGHAVLFPTLKKDWHGKLSGAFSKFFGRYLRSIGITDERKVMYSFRHTMKDLLEQAGVPSKYLQRVLGHTSGDGTVTDGYGSDVPFDRLAGYFRMVNFPPISAAAWQPGSGRVRLKQALATAE